MELRRGAPCVRPHPWHRYEVTVVSRGVDECMSVVTVTITEAQFSQTGAGTLTAMQVIGSTDISESKQHCQNTQATTRTRVAMFHPSSSTFHRPQTVEGRANRHTTTVPSIPGSETQKSDLVRSFWATGNRAGNKIFVTYRNESAPASFKWQTLHFIENARKRNAQNNSNCACDDACFVDRNSAVRYE